MNYKEKFTYRFLQFLSRHLNNIDEKRRSFYISVLAGFIYKFLPIRKSVALKNIKIAFPEQDMKWTQKVLKSTLEVLLNLTKTSMYMYILIPIILIKDLITKRD